MYSYITYGLSVHSELLLPELLVNNSRAVADVVIRLGHLNPPPLKATESECFCHVTATEAYLSWKDEGTFLVRNGREIVIEPSSIANEQVLRIYLLGAALGLLLHQRGLMTLHANTVVVNKEAIAFIGERGMGKSTTTGAMLARGHLMLSDDVSALNLNHQGSPLVLPGFPQLKLWCDSASSLGHDPDTLPLIHPDFEKRARRSEQGFATTSVPLKCIYVLSSGSQLEIEPLPSSLALAAVMRNWYCARFGRQMLQVVGSATHFQQCIDLVNRVNICILKRQRDLSKLDDIARCVENHFTHTIQKVAAFYA